MEKMIKRSIKAFVILVVTIALIGNSYTKTQAKAFTKASVVYVIDGDTIIAKVKNKEIKVRMIGVNTPESVHRDISKNTKQGVIASKYTKEKLKKGKIIYLEYDKDRTDSYGRTLAYIWTKKIKKVSYKKFCKYNFGALLLKNTYCESVYYKPNGKYKKWYDKLEKKYQ